MKVKRIVANIKTKKISAAERFYGKALGLDLSIEVDDVDEAFSRMKKGRFKIVYPLTEEPWGVRRFFVPDPFGRTVNILEHR